MDEDMIAPDMAGEQQPSALEVLMLYAQAQGDISDMLTDEQLAKLADQVCTQYDRDLSSREDWENVASKALEDMAKCDYGEKDYPWKGASNVHYPLLAYAVMQFNARSYPAIVKGDEAVSIKVVGADRGKQAMSPMGPVFEVQGMPVVMSPQGPVVMTPQGPMPLPEGAEPQPMWERPPGHKTKRAARVRDYMNTVLFYRMDDWESETDTLLFQMPAIGCGFRKTWFDGKKHNARFVPALDLVVDNDSKSLADAPQIAERIVGVFPHLIKRDMARGWYRQVEYLQDEDREARTLIEAQCYYDMDEDGIDEPYIVTIDHKERTLLRVVPDFGPEQVNVSDEGLAFIERREFYTKYEFLPHPQGKFYNPGLAHFLEQYGEVVNTIINQMIDANHAATAGGGFIGSGLRIQGQGQSSSLRFRPGEYKTVPVTGDQLRNGIYERPYPQLSSVMFNLLDLILGAAKDIASVKDVLSGDASTNGPVGTTLALIEQGLQVFTAIYKRVYRGLKRDFELLFRNIGQYADEATAQDYLDLLDDPEADFATDFGAADMDIRPVSDPSSVTKMQKMARAQFLMSTVETLQAVGGDAKEALRRAYEAADVEDIAKLLPDAKPDPMTAMAAQLEMANKAADTKAKEAKALKDTASVDIEIAKVQQKGAADETSAFLDAERMKLDAVKTGFGLG